MSHLMSETAFSVKLALSSIEVTASQGAGNLVALSICTVVAFTLVRKHRDPQFRLHRHVDIFLHGCCIQQLRLGASTR